MNKNPIICAAGTGNTQEKYDQIFIFGFSRGAFVARSLEDVKAGPLGKMNDSFTGGFRLFDTFLKLRPSGTARVFGGAGGPTRENTHASAQQRRREKPDEWWPPSFPAAEKAAP